MVLLKGTVKPDWVDYNGHMGDYAYTIVFSEGVAAFMDRIGLDAVHRRETGCTLRVAQLRIAFLRELHEGESYEVRLRIIDRQAESVRLFGRMIDTATGLDAALADQLLVYTSQAGDVSGRACGLPEEIRIRIDQLHDSNTDEPLAPWLQSRIGIRRKA